MNIMNGIRAPIGRAGALVGLILLAGQALACDLTLWNGGKGGDPLAAQPNQSPNAARYSGFCGMETRSGQVDYVQDNSPGGIARIRARFYVLNELDPGQSGVVYRGFSSTTGAGVLFSVFLSAAGNVTLVDNATGQSVSQSGSTDWLSVEIDWSQGSGNGVIRLSVNGQTATVDNSLSNSGAGLQAVRLGNLGAAIGTLTFDAYESRRTTEIGRLLAGDADNNGSVGGGDITAVIDEFLNGNLASGQPDCDENGTIGGGDISCIISTFLGG